MLHIDLHNNGLTLNGNFMEQITPECFVEVLGKPRESLFKNEYVNRKVWIWDDLGLLINIPTTPDEIPSLECRLLRDEAFEKTAKFNFFDLNPAGFFTGKITFNGKDILNCLSKKEIAEINFDIKKVIGHWKTVFELNDSVASQIKALTFDEDFDEDKTDELLEILTSESQPFKGFWFVYNPPKTKQSLPKKYQLRKATTDDLVFDNFNFKLAIIEELMYCQGILTPIFDVFEFCKAYHKRQINPFDYYDEMIPEVKQWFEDLPIPKHLAQYVHKITLDGGNDIFLELIPQWDGEDNIFDINEVSESEFLPFSNLKTIHANALMMSKKAEQFFKEKGIDIEK